MIKEYRLEDINPVENVKTKIWSMFDVIRKSGAGLNESYVILLFLSLYKDGIISRDFVLKGISNDKQELFDNIHDKNNELYKDYEPIIESFSSTLIHIKESGFKELINILFEINNEVLTSHFPEIFDSVLYRITQSQGRYGGEFIQPVELTRFICSLAKLPKKASVYNPFAGLASFGVYLDQGQDYYGQELNRTTWALGSLRIMAYERPGESRFVCQDSILSWPDSSVKFDLIIANPPFGVRLGNQYRDKIPDVRTIEQFLLERGIQSLNDSGQLIALMPQGVLFRGMQEERLRKFLVDEDLIDTIIALPGGLLSNTGVSLVIMVLSKQKVLPQKVRFIDAKKHVTSKSPREKVLNDYSLNSIINGSRIDDETVRIVCKEQIIDFNYNLNVPRYFQEEIEGVKLGKIIEPIRGQRGNLPKSGKTIRIRDLKDDKLDFRLDISKLETTEIRRADIVQVSESCLLLATRWRSFKPTLFEYDDEPIYKSQDILAFKVNTEIADIAYLVNELHADYVTHQLDAYQLGSSIMPFIRRDDLMEIIIKLPPLEEQRAKIQGINELSSKIKLLQEERNALVHGSNVKQYSEFASLKHTLGRPRQNILDWADNLLHFINTHKESVSILNREFAEFYDIDIFSALQEIKRDVNFITDVLEKGENGFILEDYEKQILALTDINNIINEVSSNGFKFRIKRLLLKGENLKTRGIYANRILFKTLIDNLLTNADKYGFDKKDSSNEVVIELTEVDDFLVIEVRNNGNPFPKNFDRDKFITKYSTANSNSGSGLGGYDIHRIATFFSNPDWELCLNEDPLFLVKFKFQFPIKLIK